MLSAPAYEQHGVTIDRGNGRRTKRIADWHGFLRNGVWSESASEMEAGSDPGDINTGETFSYGEQSAKSPLQLYLKNSDDPTNATRVHGRYSDDPASWFEVAANRGGPGFVDGVEADVTVAQFVIVPPQGDAEPVGSAHDHHTLDVPVVAGDAQAAVTST